LRLVYMRLRLWLGGLGLRGRSLREVLEKRLRGSLLVVAPLHPWVLSNLTKSWTLGCIVLQERDHQILKLAGEACAVNLVEIE
jgi:hypothetical protein